MQIASKNEVVAEINFVSQNVAAKPIGIQKGDLIMGVNNQPVIGNNLSQLLEGLIVGR